MKTLSSMRCFGALLWLCMAAVPGLAQTATPTPAPTYYSLTDPDYGIFTSDDEADEDEVRDAARVQAAPNGVPAYKSNEEETRFYEGYFKAKTDDTKLALLSDDGTSVWIDDVPVLRNANRNQGFEASAAATFSLIPKTFVAGRIYHLKLQYTNTIHTGDADVDGISLWAYAGGGEIFSKVASLTASTPDFIVYRDSNDALPEIEPEPSPTAENTVIDPGESGGSLGGDGEIEGSSESQPDSDPEPTPEPQETPPADILPQPEQGDEAENPIIRFGVRVSGYPRWQATIKVYALSEVNGALGTVLAELTTNRMEVRWNELFPGQKPQTGLYTYDIQIRGIEESGRIEGERFVGLDGDQNSKVAQRLDTSLVINDLQLRLLDESEATVARNEMNRPRFASRDLTRLAQILPPVANGDEWRVAELKFKALKSGRRIPENAFLSLNVLDPLFKRDATLRLNREEGNYYYYRLILKDDQAKKLGKWPVTAGVRFGVQQGIGAQIKIDRSAKVEEIRAGFIVVDSNGRRSSDDRFPRAGGKAKFQAFLKVRQYGQSQWYSSDSNRISYGGEWLGGIDFSGRLSSGRMESQTPIGWKAMPDALRSALGVNIEWIRFRDKVVLNNGGKRFYGLSPEVAGRDLKFDWPLQAGTSWWGFKATRNNLTWGKSKAKVTKFYAALPTGHNKYVYRHDNTQNNIAQLPGKRLNLFLPDPSAHVGWNGQISAELPTQSIGFDADDPFFKINGVFSQSKYNQQTALHQSLLREAGMFIGAPYGWAGQTFGGKQSLSANFYTNSDTGAVPGEVVNLGASVSGFNGYGVDCSGFITEPAKRVGIAQPATPAVGMDTGMLHNGNANGNGSRKIEPQFVRPGDFIVWRRGNGGHVIYVKSSPSIENVGDNNYRIRSTSSLEAYPDTGGRGGRVLIQNRNATERRKSWEDASEYSFRRWGQ